MKKILAALLLVMATTNVFAISSDDLLVREYSKKSSVEFRDYDDATLMNIGYTGAATGAVVGITLDAFVTEAPLGTSDLSFDMSAAAYDTLGELCDAIDAEDDYSCDLNGGKRDDDSSITTNITAATTTDAKAAGVEDYTLDADICKIIDIYGGDNNSLENITLKNYHKYKKADPALGQIGEGAPGWYLYIGRAATGARKVRIGNIPSTTTTLTGFGKLWLTRFTEAELGTGKSMLPFPVDGEDVLAAFVRADIYRLQGKVALIFPQETSAEAKLKAWRGEEMTEPANSATSGLPAYLRSKLINRRRGYVV